MQKPIDISVERKIFCCCFSWLKICMDLLRLVMQRTTETAFICNLEGVAESNTMSHPYFVVTRGPIKMNGCLANLPFYIYLFINFKEH